MISSTTDLKGGIDRASELVSDERYEDAIQELKELLETHPDSEEVQSILCHLHLALEKTEFPKEWILNALRADPSLSTTFIEFSSLLYEKNRFRACSDILEALVWGDPDNHEAWNNLGVVRFSMGDLVTSEKAFNQALALRPGYGESIANLSALYMETKRPDLAVHTAMASLEEKCDATPELMREMAGLLSNVAPDNALKLLRESERRREGDPDEQGAP